MLYCIQIFNHNRITHWIDFWCFHKYLNWNVLFVHCSWYYFMLPNYSVIAKLWQQESLNSFGPELNSILNECSMGFREELSLLRRQKQIILVHCTRSHMYSTIAGKSNWLIVRIYLWSSFILFTNTHNNSQPAERAHVHNKS